MFIETPRFPETISYGATGGPGYSTVVTISSSGNEARNMNWATALGSYDVAHGLKNPTQMAELLAFFRNCKGRGNGFRFKDWTDYNVTGGTLTATGVTDKWQMYKRYTTGSNNEDRVIKKPVAGTVTVQGGGTYTVDFTTGIVTRTAGANPTSWSGEFDVPCRFDTDSMKVGVESYDLYSWGQIPVVEVRA